MIKLFTWTTPNGEKPAIMLEELGLDYEMERVDISAGMQKADLYLKVNPNGKIPALVDGDVTIFESGAILQYLAGKTGRFLSPDGQPRAAALSWSYWQVGGLGPMIGQWGHFMSAKPPQPEAAERFLAETVRLFGVLETGLTKTTWLAGDDYSIADIMCFSWAKGGLGYLDKVAADRLPDLTNTRAWIARIDARPAVIRALDRLHHPENEQEKS